MDVWDLVRRMTFLASVNALTAESLVGYFAPRLRTPSMAFSISTLGIRGIHTVRDLGPVTRSLSPRSLPFAPYAEFVRQSMLYYNEYMSEEMKKLYSLEESQGDFDGSDAAALAMDQVALLHTYKRYFHS